MCEGMSFTVTTAMLFDIFTILVFEWTYNGTLLLCCHCLFCCWQLETKMLTLKHFSNDVTSMNCCSILHWLCMLLSSAPTFSHGGLKNKNNISTPFYVAGHTPLFGPHCDPKMPVCFSQPHLSNSLQSSNRTKFIGLMISYSSSKKWFQVKHSI